MLRRTFLIGVMAVTTQAGASSEADPLATASRALKKRLVAFARVIALHRWPEAVGYFDPDHNTYRHKLFFSPEFNEEPPDPNNPVDQEAFLDWYLRETLGLATGDEPIAGMDEVIALRYRGLEEPSGADGPIRVLMDVETRGGPKSVAFLVDRASLAFFAGSD